MRKYKRSLARARMQREGIQHINRRTVNPLTGRRNLPSYFAENWRKYASKNY